MPKAKVEVVTPIDANTEHVTVEVGERGVNKLAEYDRPTVGYFQSFVASLTDVAPKEGEESPLKEAWRLYVTSLDRRARAAVYESIAAESTEITVGKEKVDIMTFPLPRLIKAINGTRGRRDAQFLAMGIDDPSTATEDQVKTVDRSIGFGPWRTAANKLVEDKKAVENATTGMLEVATP